MRDYPFPDLAESARQSVKAARDAGWYAAHPWGEVPEGCSSRKGQRAKRGVARTLPPNERLIEMRNSGMTLREIASACNATEGGIKFAFYRIRREALLTANTGD